MKKGIKSLMLIAAAAMTFTSCQKENKAQVNDGKGTVKVNFTSVADGTKTYFGDRTTDKYPTLWTGDEKVGITYLDTDLDNEGNNVVEVNGKGETTTFSAELAEPSSKEGSIFVFSPWYKGNYTDADAGGFTRYSSTNKNANVVIPTTQVSTPTSCDPKAQLLVAKYDFTNGVANNVDVIFTHATAYGKVTINGVDAKIKTVKIDFGQNVTGTGLYYYTADNEQYGNKAGELKAGNKYNNTYVEIDNSKYPCDKTFWFGIPAISCEGKTVVVTVTDENDKEYTKAITSESKVLKFEQGKVSTFTVTVVPKSEEKTYTTVANLRAKGETTVTEDVYAKVTVVSDKDGGNSTSLRNIVVSDATAGITIRFAANSDLAIGTELELNLQGAQLSKHNGLLQLNNFANDKAVATGVVKKLDPVSISAADLMSGKYESMYVSVADVQVVESELNGTVGDASNHKSVNMEAKTGEKFIMFTSKYSKFVEDKLPQGSGALKGIASINTNKEGETSIQMLPTVASDYAALTGARFSSGTATLSFGTPVFKANLFKEKVAIEGGKLTIPYSNADGTEKYTVSVAVSGAAANGINAVSNKEVALAKGSGNIEIAITGTPANAGAVTFEINGIEALSVKTVKANVASATTANYDSNVTVPEDETNSVYTSYKGADLLVKIDGNSYKCVKFGTSKKTGVGTTTVLPKTGDAKLTFYAYGWKGKKGALKITVNNGGTINGSSSVTTDAINGNNGCTGNGPFELSSVDTSALLSYELKDMTDKTTITIESTKENGATDPRVVIFAINVK